jgi:phage gp45-like
VEDQPLECELQGEDLNGQAYKMVRIANRTTSWARKNNFESGESTIFATSGAEIIDGTGELIIPSGSTIEVSNAWFLFLD